MKHISLFSGIGGFDLAAEWMGWENVAHCEWNYFGQYNLKHYWPNAHTHTQILQQQTSLFTEELLTSSQEDFPVSHIAQRVKEKEKKIIATSGRKCLEQYERFSRPGLWGKTFAALLIGMEDWYSTKCRLTWKMKATKSHRFYFQLVPSTRLIEEIESGLLPTPRTQVRETTLEKTMERKAIYGGEKRAMYLENYLVMGLLPTPKASEGERGSERMLTISENGKIENISPKGVKYGKGIRKLAEQGFLPTPTAQNWKGSEKRETIEKRGRIGKNGNGSTLSQTFSQIGKSSQLNPQFVMEMMGFPPNHCDNSFEKIAMEYYLKKRSTKSFMKRMELGEKKQSKPEEMQ